MKLARIILAAVASAAVVALLLLWPSSTWSLTGHAPTGIYPPLPSGTYLALSRETDNQRFPPFPADWTDLITRIAALSPDLQSYPQATRDDIVSRYLRALNRQKEYFGALFSLEFDSDVTDYGQVVAQRPRVIQLVRSQMYVNGSLKHDWGDFTAESAKTWLRNGGQEYSGGWIVDLVPQPGKISGPNGIPYYNDYGRRNSALVQGYNDSMCIMWDLPGPTWRSMSGLKVGGKVKDVFQFQTYVVADGGLFPAITGPHLPLGFVEWGFAVEVRKGKSANSTRSDFTGVYYRWVDTWPNIMAYNNRVPSPQYSWLMTTNYPSWLASPTN